MAKNQVNFVTKEEYLLLKEHNIFLYQDKLEVIAKAYEQFEFDDEEKAE